ncbi:MAG: hypothetical protein ACRC6E_03955 [Fusobacteriaceae bacterium]
MKSEIIIYELEDEKIELKVNLENETVWLTQKQMAELFNRDRTVIGRHINNIFKEDELEEESNVQKMHFPNSDKPIALYSLDVIISVGYRVKSKIGTKKIELDEAKGLLNVVSQYSYALKILDDYDHQNLQRGSVTLEEAYK